MRKLRAGNWETGDFERDYQHKIVNMSDQRGQVKRNQLPFLCQEKQMKGDNNYCK